MYKSFLKRLMDIFISGIAIIVLAIPMLIVTIVIKIDDPGPVLFKQKRVGKKKNSEITYFMIWKFRSMKMCTPHDVPTHLLENPEQYITRVGRYIRKTSIDELPQLFNVLRGDMSIVGPRPALPREVEQYDAYAMQRLIVSPGLTCYWQIQPNRNSLRFEEWMDLDIRYLQDMSFRTDWKILFATVKTVLRMDGQ